MADFLDILKSYVPSLPASEPRSVATSLRMAYDPTGKTQVKQADPKTSRLMSTEEELAQIDSALSTPQNIALANLSIDRDNDLLKNNKIVQDYKSLSSQDFSNRHGVEAQKKMDALMIGGAQIDDFANTSRSIWQHVGDGALDLTSGTVQAVTGLNDLALRATPLGQYTDVLDYNAQLSSWIKDKTDSLHSDEAKKLGTVAGFRAELDAQDDARAFERDKMEQGDFTAQMRSIGRGVIRGIDQMVEDPFVLEKSVSEGIGTLLVGGPTSKVIGSGAKLANQAISKAIAPVGVLTNPGARIAESMIEKASFPVAIGALEAGSNAIQTHQDVMAIPQEELEKTPEYQELIKTMSPEDARMDMALRAGNTAASISGLVGGVTGKLVEGFEKAPLALLGKPASILESMGREFVEETIQSAAGQLAGNTGKIISGAQPDLEVTTDVGKAAIEGGLAGSLAPAVLQGPSAVVKATTKAAINTIAAPLKYAAKVFKESGEKTINDLQKGATVSEESLSPVVQEQAAKAADVAQAVNTLATEAGAQPEEAAAYATKVNDALKVQDTDLKKMPDVVSEQVTAITTETGRTPDKYDVMTAASKIANDEKASPQDRVDAATFVLKTVENNAKTFQEDAPDYMVNAPEDRPERKAFDDFTKLLNVMTETPVIQQAMKWAREKMVMPKISEEALAKLDLNSDAGRKTVSNLVDVATVAPQAIDPVLAAHVLNQADSAQLTPSQRRIVRSALSTHDTERAHAAKIRTMEPMALDNQVDELQQELKATENTDERMSFVGKEINTEDGAKGPSLNSHVAGISLAVSQGDLKGARKKAQNLEKFAQSHLNKIVALNQSIANKDGKNVPYSAYKHTTDEFFTHKGGVGITVGNAGGERFARTIHAEAMALAQQSNEIAKIYPAFGIKQVTVPALALDTERGSPTISDSAPSSQATTSRTTDQKSKQVELPLAPAPIDNSSEAAANQEAGVESSNVRAGKTSSGVISEEQLDAPLSKSTLSWIDKNGATQDIAVIKEMIARSNLASAQEKQSDPDDWTNEEKAAYAAGNTREFSTLRGYTEEEISNFERYLELANKLIEKYGVDFAASLTHEAPPTEKSTPVPAEDSPALLDDTEAAPVEPKTTAELFPLLVQPKGRNWFHSAFRMPKKAISRLISVANPLEAFVNALDSAEALKTFLDGNTVKYVAGPAHRTDLQSYLDLGGTVKKTMNSRLRQFLATKDKTKPDQPTVLDRLQAGEEINRYVEYRALNILEKGEKGFRYNQQLVETAIIAGLEWALNAQDRNATLSKKDVASALGVDMDMVTDDTIKEFNRGLSLDMAVKSLAQNIRQFWGVEANPNEYVDFVDGIPEAVAKEVLYGLEAVGLVDLGIGDKALEYKFPGSRPKTFNRVWFHNRSVPMKEALQKLDPVQDLLSSMALTERRQDGYLIGEPVTEVDTIELRNPLVQLSEQAMEELRVNQQTPYRPIHVNFDFYEALGRDNFVTVMSGHPYEEGNLKQDHDKIGLNKGHWKSVKGLQQTLVNSYANVTKQMAAVRMHGRDLPVYYKHHINSLGRSQMAGSSNYQSDKLSRHVFAPTISNLNLTDRTGLDWSRFLLMVAQGIGEKTEKKYRSDTMKVVEDKVLSPDGEFHPLVQEMKTWLSNREAGTSNQMSDTLVEGLRNAGLSIHGQTSLLEVARYLLAVDNGQDVSAFESNNYLEADGKTNGMFNALMNWASDAITPEFLRQIEKAGVFFGRLGKTINSHINLPREQGGDPEDLYQDGANETTKNMADLAEKLRKRDPRGYTKFMALRRLMLKLDIGATLDDDGNLKIDRKTTKNPMTITIYASGAKGIAGNITDELITLIYEKMSDSMVDGNTVGEQIYGAGKEAEFWKDMRELFSDKDGKGTSIGGGKVIDFEFLHDHKDKFQANVLEFLVRPMRKAIDKQVTNHVSAVTKKMQQATQLQSIVYKAMQDRDIALRLARRKADPEKYADAIGLSFTGKELDEIRKANRKFAPFISTGAQNYFLAGSERSSPLTKKDAKGKRIHTKVTLDGAEYEVQLPETFSRSISDDMMTPALYPSATLAGVAIIPTMTIGIGDGQMMMNFASDNPVEAKRTGPVFDGLHMPGDSIEDFSQLINEAVYKTFTSNTNGVRAVADSFTAFVNASPAEQLFDVGTQGVHQEWALEEISKVFYERGTPEKTVTPEEAKEFFLKIQGELNVLADKTDVRRKTFADMPVSVDQMSSGENPFSREGTLEIPEDADIETVARIMEERRMEYLSELATAGVDEPATKTEKGLEAFVTEFGRPDDSGAMVLLSSQLNNVTKMLRGASGLQKEMIEAAVAALRKNSYTVVFGTPAELDAFEREYNADEYKPGTNTGKGKIYPGKKWILISNMRDVETLTHELIHAATYERMLNARNNPGSVSREEREAVSRLDALMVEWLDEIGQDDNLDADHQTAFNVVDGLKDSDRPAAVNEFMAWVLANQGLAERANKIETKNPIFRIAMEALAVMKEFFFGKTKVGNDVLSHLRFNTRIVMQMNQSRVSTLKQDFSKVVLHQSASFGSDERLTGLRQKFYDKIVAWVKEDTGNPITPGARKMDTAADHLASDDIANSFARFFPGVGTMLGKSTFAMIQTALRTEMKLDANSMSRIEDIYTHTIKTIQVEDFRQNNDPQDQDDAYKAQQKYDALAGLYISSTDRSGRSALMSSFLALAMVDDGFRKILHGMEKPKSEKTEGKTLDAVLENFGNASLDRLSLMLAGEKSSDITIRDALDSLTQALIDNTEDQKGFIEQTEGLLARANDAVVNAIQDGSAKIAEKSADIIRNTDSRTVKLGASMVSAIATVVNEQKAQDAQKGLTQWFNRRGGFNETRALLNDLSGETDDNTFLVGMVAKVRSTVDQLRQRFREVVPKKLRSEFTKELPKETWTVMFKALAKTDIAILGVNDSIDLLTDRQRLAAEIKIAEASIQNQESANRFARIKVKARQLAHFMNSGEHGQNLLSNAYAVTRLMTEGSLSSTSEPATQLVEEVDRLISLYALDELSQDTTDQMVELIKGERNGVEFVISYLMGQRKDELAKIGTNNIAKANHFKGNIPSQAQQGGSLVIKDTSEEAHLILRGYKKVADYVGSSADRYLGSKAYYYSPVSSTAPFSQGVIQTVHQTVSGIDPQTGRSVGTVSAGVITNPRGVKIILQYLRNQVTTAEHLRPIFDGDFKIVAYERTADVKQLVALNKSTDLAQMIGHWRGRQMEELLAQQVNEVTIDRLHENWEQGQKDGREDEYVNIADLQEGRDDPILIEAVKLIPNQTKEYIQQVFGKGEFWVRRDVILDTFGARQASVGDLFTGQTRWNQNAIKDFEKIAVGLFGVKAFPIAVGIEKNVQEFVANAKNLIVVKSVIVPTVNMLSNMLQLLNRGVPVRHIIRGAGKKTAEINTYIKSRDREIRIEADLRAADGRGDLVAIHRLNNELQSIRDAYRRMSIWPLVQSGQFSSISNGLVTAEDLALADGKWSNFVERQISNLPKGVDTAVRYGLVTKDTALFQGLARATQYGDFVAKAILYDDLVSRKKVKHEKAISTVSDAFVNYNRLAGRNRQYLESIGALWFYNYKLRIAKEAVYLLRNNPLRALLMMGLPSFGSPIESNIFSLGWENKLGFSIGPSMGIHSFGLNPLINAAS